MHGAHSAVVDLGENPLWVNAVYCLMFFAAVVHTFVTKQFEHLAHVKRSDYDFKNGVVFADCKPNIYRVDHFLARHERIFDLLEKQKILCSFLGEIEFVFLAWCLPFGIFMFFSEGWTSLLSYANSRNLTEPSFVVVIMIISASRPIKEFVASFMVLIAKKIPGSMSITLLGVLLSLGTLLGSFITEAATMTIVALLLGYYYFKRIASSADSHHKARYSILSTLLVNVSIGGVLTHYAAPPVLMVAGTWEWNTSFMMTNFGVYAIAAVLINTCWCLFENRKVLLSLDVSGKPINQKGSVPFFVTLVHLGLLGLTVYCSHYPKMFSIFFVIYLVIAMSYPHHQDDRATIIENCKVGAKVGAFLWGLVLIGGKQQAWLEPVLTSMDGWTLYFGATGLTAITDNAALTYLASLVPHLTDFAKYMIVAGAVTGGGLTIIANAPNPAGIGILSKYFGDQAVSPKTLLFYALRPTMVAALCFLAKPLIASFF